MFVHRTLGVATATLGVLAMGACSDPELNTDLRPEGPPDVLAVLVMTDAATTLYEKATYCKVDDELRPTLVGLPDFTTQQVCPDDPSEEATAVDSAFPDGWYVRIMFDELLDPSIEELTEILDEETGEGTGTFSGSIVGKNPVTLECQSVLDNRFVTIDYDGYYSPSGNRVTWPVGPSLVVKPNDPSLIGTGKECRITLHETIVDKSGVPVPEAQRGPFTFRVAPITVVAIDPTDDPDSEAPINAHQIYYDNIYVMFNTEPDPDSFCDEGAGMDECEVQITPEIGECSVSGAACEVGKNGADCPMMAEMCESAGYYAYTLYPDTTKAEWFYGPVLPLVTGAKDPDGPDGPMEEDPKEYTFTFKQGAKLRDRCGSETTFGVPDKDKNTLVRFAVNAFKPSSSSVTVGEPQPAKKLQVQMNNVVDFRSLALDEWTLTPDITVPPAGTCSTSGDACSRDSECTSPETCTLVTCVNNTDCDGIVEVAQDLTLSNNSRIEAGGECRMYGAPINGKRCANRYATGEFNDGNFVFRGFYALNTEYTFTLKAGAKISDYWGAEWENEKEVRITWTTQPSISIGTISPADEAVIGKLDMTETTSISIPFNQSMDVTTLTTDDFTITKNGLPYTPGGLEIGVGTSDSSSSASGATASCNASSQSCALRITGVYTTGTYKFTLKMNAQLKDVLGNTYTHPKDTVVTFTIEETPEQPARCL